MQTKNIKNVTFFTRFRFVVTGFQKEGRSYKDRPVRCDGWEAYRCSTAAITQEDDSAASHRS